MKSTISLLALPTIIIFLFPWNSISGQVNRANTKKSIPYRSNYQRVALSSCGFHTLEIRNGTLWAWGPNSYGQLGDGTTTYYKNLPVQIGMDSSWVIAATGNYHSLALKTDGTLWAWGYNLYGQLGDGTITNKSVPIQVGTDNNWISIAAAGAHSLGLKSNGTLWAWGNNFHGELGDGTTVNKNVPVQIGSNNDWVTIAAGAGHNLALKSDGTLWAWGTNYYGEIGDGTIVEKHNPVQVGMENNWVNIACGGLHNLGLKSDGTLWAWGRNDIGQLGDGSISDKNIPVQIGTDNNWLSITTGGYHSIALKSNGTLWAWGWNGNGQLGDGTTIDKFIPTQVGSENIWVSIIAGWGHTIGLKSDGTIWSWGLNTEGMLGDGTDSLRISPVQIIKPLIGWLKVVARESHTLSLKSDGTLWAWGNNEFGQLGDGTTIDRISPIKIGIDNNWVSISTGWDRSFALKSDGTLWAWGYNDFGGLGDGTTVSQYTPVQIGLENNWVSVAVGGNHVLGLKSDGTLWAWGNNQYGTLGDGTNTSKSSPVQIGNENTWVSISAGGAHSVGMKSDGTLWAWGYNSNGNLGDGSTTHKNSPIQIGSDNNWTAFSAHEHNLGLKSDGTLWAWGFNNSGQLGDGSTAQKESPVQVEADNKWICIEAGLMHSIGLKSDGTFWTWGNNNFGQLGDGTTNSKNSPLNIGTSCNWIIITGGGFHSVGVKSGRQEFCASGRNQFGQLGDGTTINKNIFTCNTNCSSKAPSVNETAICINDSVTLTTTGIGILGWYDQVSDGIYLGGGSTYTTPILTNTTVFFVQDSLCAADTLRTSFIVTVNSLPSLSLNLNDTTFCPGTPITLSGQGAPTYTWSNGITDGVEFTIDSTTTFKVTGTDTNNCSNTDSITITVNPLPTVTAFSTATEICIGDSISLLATGANSYAWSDSILNGISFYPAQTNTYTVIGTDTNNCSDTASIIITVNDPQAIAYTTSSNICEGEEVTLTASGAVNYSWSGGVLNNNPFIPDSTATYTVAGTDEINCSDTASITITVQPNPTIEINSTDSAICDGSAVTLTATGASSYSWTNGVTNGVSFSPGFSNTYTVIGTDSNSCSDTASISITVNPLPVVIPYATSTNICQGEAVSIIGTGAETYQWSDGISIGVSFTPTSTNTYTVIGTDTNNCSDTASILITLNPLPDASLSLDGATLTANQAQADYQWLNCDDGFSEIFGATEQSYTAVENGNYAVIVDLDGCVDTSECISVTNVSVADFTDGVSWIRVFPNPGPGIFSIQSSKPISSVTITNLIGEKIYNSLFKFQNSKLEIDGSTELTVNISAQSPGIYFLEIEINGIKERQKIIKK